MLANLNQTCFCKLAKNFSWKTGWIDVGHKTLAQCTGRLKPYPQLFAAGLQSENGRDQAVLETDSLCRSGSSGRPPMAPKPPVAGVKDQNGHLMARATFNGGHDSGFAKGQHGSAEIYMKVFELADIRWFRRW